MQPACTSPRYGGQCCTELRAAISARYAVDVETIRYLDHNIAQRDATEIDRSLHKIASLGNNLSSHRSFVAGIRTVRELAIEELLKTVNRSNELDSEQNERVINARISLMHCVNLSFPDIQIEFPPAHARMDDEGKHFCCQSTTHFAHRSTFE